MIRPFSFFFFVKDTDMNAYLSESVGGVWRGHISAFPMHRQPLHLLDLKPAGEEPSWSKDFLSPSAARLSGEHAGTQWHV